MVNAHKNTSIRTFTILVLTALLMFSSTLNATASSKLGVHKRNILQQKLGNDVKKIFLLDARKRLISNDVAEDVQDQMLKAISDGYDKQIALSTGNYKGELGDFDRGWDAYRSTLSGVVNSFTVGLGGEYTGLVADLIKDRVLEDSAKGLIESAKLTQAERNRHALIRKSRIIDEFMSTCESADETMTVLCNEHIQVDAGVGFRVDTNEADLRQNPDNFSYFLNHNVLAIEEKLEELDQQLKTGGLTDEQKTDLVSTILAPLLKENEAANSKIAKIGDAVGDVNDALNNLDPKLTGVLNRNYLALNDLLEIEKQKKINEVKHRQAQIDAERQLEINIIRNEDSAASLNLGIFILNQVDPKLGKTVSVVVNSTFAIQNALDKFEASQKLAGLGTATLTMDVLNASMAIISLFGSSDGAPSPELQYMQAVMRQIQALQQQVSQLRVEMHDRFDIIDARFDGVETKLGNIYSLVDSGFNMVRGLAAANYDAILLNAQIGLDTQSLILSESQRIADLIEQNEIGPCVEWNRISNIEMSDAEFARCVIKLDGYVTNGIKTDQISTIPDSGESLAQIINSDSSLGREVDIIYSIYSDLSGSPRSVDKMVSEQSWYKAAAWYRDFLSESPTQTDRVVASTSFDEIEQIGKNIISFKDDVLSNLSVYDIFDHTKISTHIVNMGRKIKAEVKSVMQEATIEINSVTGESILDFITAFEDMGALSGPTPWRPSTAWSDGNKVFFDYSGKYYNNVPRDGDVNETLRTYYISQLLEIVPEDIEKMALRGLGTISFNMEYVRNVKVENNYTTRGESGFDAIDEYRLEINFVTGGGNTYLIAQTSLNVRFTMSGCGVAVESRVYTSECAESQWKEYTFGWSNHILSPWHCLEFGRLDENCVFVDPHIGGENLYENSYRDLTRNFNRLLQDPFREALVFASFESNVAGQNAVRALWEDRVDRWNVLVDSKIKALTINDTAIWYNSFLQGLFRFTFSETLIQSDASFSIASGSVGLPIPNKIANAVSEPSDYIPYIGDLITLEVDALEGYFQSADLAELAVWTTQHATLNESINHLSLISSYVSIAGSRTTPQKHIPIIGFMLHADTDRTPLEAISLKVGGSGNDSNINAIKLSLDVSPVNLYLDVNANGSVDISDQLLGVSSFTQDDGMLILNLTTPLSMPVGASQFILSYDL